MAGGSTQQNTALVTGLKIQLLGGFSIQDCDVPLAGVGAARLQSLLAYLLLKRGEPQQRQHLAFLFWPDTTDAQAQTNLRTLVHRLRRVLPNAERFLKVDGHALLWRADAPCWLDIAAFEAAAREDTPLTALREAIALYRGDLLPGCYDEWIEPERERLRRRFAQAAERACHLLEMQRDYPAAIDVAQRLIHHDPLNEESFRRLMRLQALAGDRAGALRAYRTCEAALKRELGVEPEPATRELYQRLAKGDAPDAAHLERPEADAIAFIGRAAEWEHLQRAWRETLAGSARLVLIAGDAGIGKTRLSEEFAGWVERQGYATARGRA